MVFSLETIIDLGKFIFSIWWSTCFIFPCMSSIRSSMPSLAFTNLDFLIAVVFRRSDSNLEGRSFSFSPQGGLKINRYLGYTSYYFSSSNSKCHLLRFFAALVVCGRDPPKFPMNFLCVPVLRYGRVFSFSKRDSWSRFIWLILSFTSDKSAEFLRSLQECLRRCS